MQKLVKIHPLTQRYMEVDENRAKREAIDLLQYIQKNISPAKDEHEIWKHVVPLCEKL